MALQAGVVIALAATYIRVAAPIFIRVILFAPMPHGLIIAIAFVSFAIAVYTLHQVEQPLTCGSAIRIKINEESLKYDKLFACWDAYINNRTLPDNEYCPILSVLENKYRNLGLNETDSRASAAREFDDYYLVASRRILNFLINEERSCGRTKPSSRVFIKLPSDTFPVGTPTILPSPSFPIRPAQAQPPSFFQWLFAPLTRMLGF